MTKHITRAEFGIKSGPDAGDIDIKGMVEKFDKSFDKLKGMAEDALGRAEKGEKLASGVKEQIDETATAVNGLKAAMKEIEQTLAQRQRHDGPEAVKSIGRQFIESAEFKALAGATVPRGTATVEVKAVMDSDTADAAGNAGTLRVNDRRPEVITPPQRRLTIRALLNVMPTSSAVIEYDKETGFTDSTSMLADGSAAAQSDIKYGSMTAPVRTIAHSFKANRNILADAPRLQGLIDNKARYLLDLKEEAQILGGDGTGENLNGLITQATAYSAPFDPAGTETAIDILRLGMLQVVLAEYPADGFVINPIDWARIELTKDSTGRYIIGNPQGALSPNLWGLPVVATQSVTVDKFLVGAFGLGAELYDRLTTVVEVATENEDDFLKRRIAIMAAKRLALAVTRPESFVYGDLGFVA